MVLFPGSFFTFPPKCYPSASSLEWELEAGILGSAVPRPSGLRFRGGLSRGAMTPSPADKMPREQGDGGEAEDKGVHGNI